MCVMLKPLGDRVLIKPLAQPTVSESGLIHIVEHRKPDEIGTVVAVGTPTHPRKVEAEQVATDLKHLDYYACDNDEACTCGACDAARLLRDLVRREPCVKVGDTVLFSWASGQEITLNDGEERYLLMRETDLLAVVEETTE
jgi:co-chaperonin GroES (HSP10)